MLLQLLLTQQLLVAIKGVQWLRIVETVSRLHFSSRYKLSDWCFCASAIKIKSSMCSEPSKHFLYKCHGLFVNSPVKITAKSCLKCLSIH